MPWGIARSVAALAALLSGCGGELQPLAKPSLELPPVLMETVRFEGFAGAHRDVEVRATRARIDTSQRVAHLEGVRIEFRDPEHGPVSIRAQEGSLDLAADDFVLHGRVEGQLGAGEQFRTSEVRYDAEAGRVWTDQPVLVLRQNLRLEGDGLEIDLGDRKLTIRGHVRTTLGSRG